MNPTSQPSMSETQHHVGTPTELPAPQSPTVMSPSPQSPAPPTYASQPPAAHYATEYKSEQPMQSPQMQQVHPGQPFQQQQQQQQQYSQQPQQPQYKQHPQTQQYQTACPIPNLGMTSMPVDCPSCGQRALTKTDPHAGNTTHAWALGLCCLTGCLCFIPYLMSSMKDVEHKCGSCGMRLATWHKSGRVDVHAHA